MVKPQADLTARGWAWRVVTAMALAVLLRTNDPVLLSFAAALLADRGLEAVTLDGWTAAAEGSIGAVPRRLAVDASDAAEARALLADAGLGAALDGG